MHLAAVSIVRSECDIIEPFVRHNATFFDRLYILDHRSTDTTPDILRRLADDGLPLVLSREGYGIFYQGPTMTQLIKRACDDHPWDFIIPLDGDEFLRVPDRATLEAALADLDPASIGLSEVVNYIPTASDDPDELDVLRRIVHRAKTKPDTGSRIFKVVIPGAVIRQPAFRSMKAITAFASTAGRSRNAGSRGSALRISPSAPSISSSCAPSCAASPGLRARITIRAGAGITARSSSSSRASLRSRPPT